VALEDLRALSKSIEIAYPVHPAMSIAEWPEDLRAIVERDPHAEKIDAAFFRGEIWLAGDRIADVDVAQERIVHEGLHGGLKGLFGDELNPMLMRIHQSNPEVRRRVTAKREALPGISVVEATEEVLVDMGVAGEAQKLNGWAKLVAWVKDWLRRHGFRPAFVEAFSDDDVLLLLQRAGEVARGDRRGGGAVSEYASFSRAPATDTPAFKKWFGESKVVDADGKPRQVYHGTGEDIEVFDGYEAVGWFSEDPALSDDYAIDKGYGSVGPNILPAYLSIANPLDLLGRFDMNDEMSFERMKEIVPEVDWSTLEQSMPIDGIAHEYINNHRFFDALDSAGYDGVTVTERGVKTWAPVFKTQIKSATGNNGRFDRRFGDIRFSRQAGEAIASELGNLLTSQRTFNRWWHRTVGTQFHKAKKDRHFRRVFNLGQDYLTDTSRYAMLAEKEAPNLLLRLEGAGDIFKRGISKADREAIAKPIFEGTLDDKLWTDEELADRYGLNERQIGYFHEFRAAVDRSLDELAKATMAKMAKGIGLEMPAIMSYRDLSLNEFHGEVASLMRERARLLKEAAEQMGDSDPGKALALERADTAKTQLRAMSQLYNRVVKLKDEGYAPLMRFGEYSVYVTQEGADGGREQVFFGLYETQREANAAAKALELEYPDADVSQGILSKEAWRVFQGLSPDTVEIFAKAAGLDAEPLFQDYLRLAVNNRSALKRLIHRKGVPGFSQDVTRVLASFVTSNARLTSSNYHLGEMQAAVDAIPKSKGDVRDEAVLLWKYLADPVEEAGALRGFLFFQFLGGSIASALVNATQPVTMTAPYLAKFADAATVAAELGKATMEAAGNKPGADVRQAYERAVEEGIVAPHEIYQLMAQARGNALGASGISRAMKVWGAFFSLAEAFNRRATFVAAYRIAVKKGQANPYEFAKQAVHETQGIYNKGNRPNWARGPVGATVFTFKQFSISYVEFLKRLHGSNPKAFWLALAILMLAAGLEGMPFAEDIEDVLDTIGQWLGYSTNTKKWLRDHAAEALGEGAAAFVLHGISALPGFPLDVSLRMGLQNLIPGTALFKRSEADKAREATEVLGPVGGVALSAGRALESAAKGDVAGAARHAAPKAIADLLKGAEMWEKGYYTDGRGRRVIDTTGGEAVLKAAGFQPARVAAESRNINIIKETIDLHRVTESGIADKWARAIVEQDQKKIDEARRELEQWNEKNPEEPIKLTFSQIQRRVLEMRRTRAERFTKSAPKELRGQVAKEIGR
jgi:hypothetical protein